MAVEQSILTSMLKANDRVFIDPYTIIYCDCYIVSDTSSVNRSLIKGELIPKPKNTNDFLLAGTRNGPGLPESFVNQDQQGSFLSYLVRTVEDASIIKATVQQSIDRVTKRFVSFVFFLSTAVVVKVPSKPDHEVLFIPGLNLASQQMMAILAAARPCALGMATLCAIMAGIDSYIRGEII